MIIDDYIFGKNGRNKDFDKCINWKRWSSLDVWTTILMHFNNFVRLVSNLTLGYITSFVMP